MSRGLSTDIKNVLSSNKFNLAVLVKFEFNTTYYYNNSYKTITYDSNNYISGGIILDLADIQEDASINTGQINLTLSNASTTILTDLLTYGHIDKAITVFFALLNDDSTVVDSPFEVFAGSINGMRISESAKESKLVLNVSNHWAQLNQWAGRTLTDSSQQRFFNGDLSFDFVPQVGKEIVWGTAPDYDPRTHQGVPSPGVIPR